MNKLNFLHNKLFRFMTLLGLIVLLAGVLPTTSVKAEPPKTYQEQFRLEQASTRFYVTNLTVGDTWKLNCTSVYRGIFYLFLFAERPDQRIIDKDGSLMQERVDIALAYNSSYTEIPSATIENETVATISLEYEILESSLAHENLENKSLFYLEIVCMENGPDTFILGSNFAVEAYFIPFIPGFPYAVLLPIISISLLAIVKKYRKNGRN